MRALVARDLADAQVSASRQIDGATAYNAVVQTLRPYSPKPEALDGTWKQPPLERQN